MHQDEPSIGKKKTYLPQQSFSITKARKAQIILAQRVITEDILPQNIHYVAGVDVAYFDDKAIGVVAVLDYDSQSLVEFQKSVSKISIAYIPTLLSFREIPPIVMSIRKLTLQPDLLMVDGQGIAHPYRCGFATHLGIVANKPTIGVAKSRLIGRTANTEAGDVEFLVDSGEIIGAALKSRKGASPLYVSTGHMISLSTAMKIVKKCVRSARIPEPLLKAHQLATLEKRKAKNLTIRNRLL